MHASAMKFAADQLAEYFAYAPAAISRAQPDTLVVEYGAQDVNGTIRDVLPSDPTVSYFGIDLEPGVGVNFVGDCRNITAHDIGRHADVVVCTNVLEHVQDWGDIIGAAYRLLAPGGWLILQCAGPGFQVHSGRSESLVLEPDEWYGNVAHLDLNVVMVDHGFKPVHTWEHGQWPCDTYGVGIKP